MMEAVATPALIMSKADLLLELLIFPFDPPSQFRPVDEIGGELGYLPQGREPVLGRLDAVRPLDQEPFLGWSRGAPVIAMRAGQTRTAVKRAASGTLESSRQDAASGVLGHGLRQFFGGNRRLPGLAPDERGGRPRSLLGLPAAVTCPATTGGSRTGRSRTIIPRGPSCCGKLKAASPSANTRNSPVTKHQIEVITSVERRRRWSREEKERLVAATLEPWASVSRSRGRPASE